MTKLTVSTKIYAPLEKVRHTRTTTAAIMQRNHASDDRHCPASSNDLRVGGTFSSTMAAKDGSFSFDYVGTYTLVEPMQHLEFVLGEFPKHGVPEGRKVQVMFEEDGSCGCVTVTETFDAEELHSTEQQLQGWQAILDNFKKVCEA